MVGEAADCAFVFRFLAVLDSSMGAEDVVDMVDSSCVRTGFEIV